MATQSHACCTVPAVVDHEYKEKGDYVTIAGTKVYATGPADANKAILFIFDIFGYFPQTLQGADILAYGDKEQQYRVYMPDFFDGKPAGWWSLGIVGRGRCTDNYRCLMVSTPDR